MKPLNLTQLADSVSRLESEASEVLSAVDALEENLRNLKTELRNFDKSGPLGFTIKTSDAAAIKSWLKNLRKVHALFYTDPSPELDRLIDLLPSE